MPNYSGVWNLVQQLQAVAAGNWPAVSIGLFGGGYTTVSTNVIDYVAIGSGANATDFGDLTSVRNGLAACSSTTRGLFGGGTAAGDLSSAVNVIDYVTIATTGNATDFGDLSQRRTSLAACSSSTRGVFGGGALYLPAVPTTFYYNIIDYVTIATTGNATDFGDLTVTVQGLAACSSDTRGLFGGGGTDAPDSNVINYITIATTGNATDFGDLTSARNSFGACSSNTRGLFGGGSPLTNVIEYVTIATTGNATDFGDLTVARYGVAACSSSTLGVFGGGNGSGSTLYNVIDSVTIATTGNATDFGDLTVARRFLGACSNAHGGL